MLNALGLKKDAAAQPSSAPSSSAEPQEDPQEEFVCSGCCAVRGVESGGKCPDFGRPQRFEVLLLGFLSLFISFVFWGVEWIIAVFDFRQEGDLSAGILENGLESFLDFLSTCVVIWRLWPLDCLEPSRRNVMVEARTAVVLSVTMLALGGIFIAFAVHSLATYDITTEDAVVQEVYLSAPSALLYIFVGMMQLQASWILRLRSLRQDAIISILGCVVAMGTLSSSLANLTEWVGESQQGLHGNALARVHFRYWWLEDVCTIVTASFLLFFGCFYLYEDVKAGHRWWTPSFWTEVLPPPSPRASRLNEQTPLKQ